MRARKAYTCATKNKDANISGHLIALLVVLVLAFGFLADVHVTIAGIIK
jgi:hypothetical protein